MLRLRLAQTAESLEIGRYRADLAELSRALAKKKRAFYALQRSLYISRDNALRSPTYEYEYLIPPLVKK